MSEPESFGTFHDGSHEDLSLEGRGTLNPDLFVFTVGSRERRMEMTSIEQHLQNIQQPDREATKKWHNKQK